MSIMEHRLIMDNSVLKHYVLPLITENSGTADSSRQTPVLFVLFCQFVSKQKRKTAEHVDTAVKNF